MMQAHALYEGSYSVDSSKKFIPFDPAKHDRKERPASLFIHVHPFLIETPSGLIILDAGLGFPGEDGQGLLIHENLRKRGFHPENVSYVLLSHLHKDHAGGLMVKNGDGELDWELAFPNAEYVVQRAEWEENYLQASESGESGKYDVLFRSGNLNLVEGDGRLNNEISYELSGGHTANHQVFHIHTGGEHYFFAGDEAPEPEQFFRSFAAKYDFDGKKAMQLREEYWQQGREEGWIFLFYHSTNISIGRPELMANGMYKIVDASKS